MIAAAPKPCIARRTTSVVKSVASEPAIDRAQGDNAWLRVSFREGKNREVRRVMEHLGLRVNRLIRTAFGPFRLDNLPSDGIREASRKMVSEALGRGMHDDADK